MDSFEGKLGRLSPEQRREVEDFVDFLLLKNNFSQTHETADPLPQVMMNAPPVLTADLPPAQFPVRVQDLVIQDESRSPVVHAPPHVRGIISDSDEGITRDYMDYTRFEQTPSPATEAVKKVKQKIIAREAEDTSRHMLDWVD